MGCGPGWTIVNPEVTTIEPEVTIGQDTILEPQHLPARQDGNWGGLCDWPEYNDCGYSGGQWRAPLPIRVGKRCGGG